MTSPITTVAGDMTALTAPVVALAPVSPDRDSAPLRQGRGTAEKSGARVGGDGVATTTKTLSASQLAAGLLTVAQACRLYPGSRGNQSLNPSTMTRWILKGCPSRGGARIKLKATRCGSRWLIDQTELVAFFEALGGTTSGEPAVPSMRRMEVQRQAACQRAARELERRGA